MRPSSFESLAWISWLALILTLSIIILVDPHRSIVGIYFQAADNWWAGRDLYQPGPHGFLYLPPSAVLHSPFALLPRPLGDAAWRLLSIGLFTAGMWRLAKLVVPANAPRLMAVMLFATIPAAGCDIIRGQSEVIMAALMMHAAADIAMRRWQRAAACLALAAGIKPLAIVLILLCAALYRPLRLPLAIAMAAVLLLPFLHSDPGYVVRQYLAAADKLMVAAEPVRGRWNEIAMMLRKFGFDPDYRLMTGVRLAMAEVTLVLAWLAARWHSLTDGAVLVLSLAVCYLLPFNPRTEEGSYITLAVIVGLHAGWVWYRIGQRPAAVALVALALGLGTQSYGDLIYRPTDLWLKPLLCLLFTASLAWRIVTAGPGRIARGQPGWSSAAGA